MARDLLADLTKARAELRTAIDNKPVGRMRLEVQLRDPLWWEKLIGDCMRYVEANRQRQIEREKQGARPK